MNNKIEEYTLCKEGAGMGVITNFKVCDNGQIGGSIRLTIAKSENGNASFGYTVSEWAGIKDQFLSLLSSEHLQKSSFEVSSENSENEKSAGVIITRFNKTAPEILLSEKEEGIKKLEAQYRFLRDNLSKYKRNIVQMEAIEEAVNLYKKGLLTESTVKKAVEQEKIFEIYRNIKGSLSSPLSGNPEYFLCSSSKVTYTFGKNYPVNVSIDNFYAKIRKTENGAQIIDTKSTLPGTLNSLSYNISRSDFSGLIESVNTSKLLFIIGNASLLLSKKEETKALVKTEFGNIPKEFFISLSGNFEEHEKLYSVRVHVVDADDDVPSEMTLRIWKNGKNDLSWVQSFFTRENIEKKRSLIVLAKVREDNLDFVERVG